MLRVISELRPAWVVGENVAGIVNMALDQVYADLENEGYSVQSLIIPACAVDAPHRRDRVCIVGWKRSACNLFYSNSESAEYKNIGKSEKGKQEQSRVGGLYTDVSDSESIRLQREWSGWDQIGGTRPEKAQPERRCNVLSDTDNGCRTLRRDGEFPAVEETGESRTDHGGGAAEYAAGEWWPTEPNVGRVANGVPSRVDRLKCLGNAVVPQQFYPVFQAIADIERGVVDG